MLEVGKSYRGKSYIGQNLEFTYFKVLAIEANWVKAKVWEHWFGRDELDYKGEMMLNINQFVEIQVSERNLHET